MSRRNRAVYPAWNGLWHIFFPWVVGVTGDAGDLKPVMPPASTPKRRRKSSLVIAGLVSMILAASPAMAENDYGDFVKIPTSQRKAAEAAAKAEKEQPQTYAEQDSVGKTEKAKHKKIAKKTDKQQDDSVVATDDGQPHFILASINANAMPTTPGIRYPNIFGANETRYEDLRPFTKWSGVLKRFRQTFEASAAKPVTRNWMNFLKAASELDREDQVKAVNTFMNKVRFIDDKENYGQSDYWATPMQFMARGGDCEDYAIAKYVSLRALGFNEKQLRMAIVYDHEMRMPHAVLIVYENDQAMVLDNQTPDVKNAANIRRYQPLYSINQLAWWRH